MFGQARLNELRARKELLFVTADAHRKMLALESRSAAHALRWAEPVYSVWQHIKPLTWVVAPVAGFYLARHARLVWRWASRFVNIFGWVGGLR